MKKILAILLAAILLISSVSCSDYEPVESTAEESKVVMTMSFGGEKYEIRYELYRALFLNNKSAVDGGDPSVWSGADKATYINKINELIISDAAKIFAAFYVSGAGAGFNVYSSKADNLVEEYVKESVEGSEEVPGFGTYEKYLSHLKSINLNYATQDLMFRYYIALEKISEFYAGTTEATTPDGEEVLNANIETTVDGVRKFYYSNDFKRVLYAYFHEETEYFKKNETTPDAFREKLILAAEEGDDAVKRIIGQSTATPTADIACGLFIPKNSFGNDLFDTISAAAFALSDGEVSEIIKLKGTGESNLDGIYILYNIEKSEEDFEKYYSLIRIAYLDDVMGKNLHSHAATLEKSVEYTSDYSSINHAGISM